MLSRQKGRDFYDAMFLLAQTNPDYTYLADRQGIHNLDELKSATAEMLNTVDMDIKKKDFEHLLFYRKNSERILSFREFIRGIK